MGNQEIEQDTELLQTIRCEDLLYNQIPQLTVLGSFEEQIVKTLKQSGAHLLQGSRGVGKSMLLRQAEVEMDEEFSTTRKLGVYVNFKASTLLEGVKADEKSAFQIWVGAKILLALHEKLIALDLIGHESILDPYQRVFKIESTKQMTWTLQEKIHNLHKLATTRDKEKIISEIGSDFLDRMHDMNLIKEIIDEVAKELDIRKIVFLFDEAAHTFIPEQQEIFFQIFKSLHGEEIAVKAAVYPTVTSYGRNFEIGQDATVISMDRFETGIGRKSKRELFRKILFKRIPDYSPAMKKILKNGDLLDQCIDLSSGNPRAFLLLLNRTYDNGYSRRALSLSTQEFVVKELLPYHQNLCKRLPKYSPHVITGLDLLKEYIIKEIKIKNNREKKSGSQSAFFTVQKDMSYDLKLSLDILCYSGLLTNLGTVKIAKRRTGLRYMIHLALMATEKAFASPDLTQSINSLSLTDYREFSLTDPQIEEYMKSLKRSAEKCPNCSSDININAKFCSQCGKQIEVKPIIDGLLEDPVSNLAISEKLVRRIVGKYPTVGDIIQHPIEDLMEIRYIKEVRSRIIKNAAEEYISG